MLGSVALGASNVACGPGYYWSSSAFFANATPEPVNVRVQSLQAAVDCNRVRSPLAELLGHRDLFGEPVTYLVPGGEALPLELDTDRSPARCGAALIQVLGFPDHVVFWSRSSGATTASKLADTGDPQFRAHAVILEGYGAVTDLVVGMDLEATPLPPANSPTAASKDAPALFAWSGVNRTGVMTLQRREQLPDGCLSLELSDAERASPFFLCAPDWSFPFQQGAHLNVASSSQRLAVSETPPGPTLEIWLGASPADVPALSATVEPLDGAGHRTDCGAYVTPLSVGLQALGAKLASGEDVEVTQSGRRFRALVDRAEEVLVAPPDCAPRYATLGGRFDLLMLDTAEESP